jgi:hypothetical protein
MTSSKFPLAPWRACAGLVAAAAVLLGPPSAARADGKVYPGVICTGDTWDSFVGQGEASGSVSLDHESDVYCPMVADRDGGNSVGLNPVRIRIWESDVPATPGERLDSRCTISRYGELGDMPYDQSSGIATAEAQNNTLTLKLTTANGPAVARYGMFCRMTEQSTLFEYEVEEN